MCRLQLANQGGRKKSRSTSRATRSAQNQQKPIEKIVVWQ